MPIASGHCSAGRDGKARAGRSREPGDLPPTVAIRKTLAERGWLMMKIAIGALAALAVAAVPASAAHVGVRVEGEAQTLLPRTAVETTTAPVGKPGEPTCDGSSALGALDRATGGDWDGPYDAGFQTYSLETVERETHDAGTSSYWAFWINYTYASLGVCGQHVQEGDDLLFVPECYAAGCVPASPLRVS